MEQIESKKMTSFNIQETETSIFLDGGLSAEICFARYIAHCKRKTYLGHNSKVVDISASKTLIFDTLNMICSTAEKNYTHKDFALISPGFCSVPYIVELMNALYLPSHLLVSFKSISELSDSLSSLKENGINAYAIAGYDSSLGSNKIVAWIRFTKIPYLYLELLKKLNIKKVLISGVWREKHEGTSFFKHYKFVKKEIDPLDIYFFDDAKRYSKIEMLVYHWTIVPSQETDVYNFMSFLEDFNSSLLCNEPSKKIFSWESGIENPKEFISEFEGEKHFLLKSSSKSLYELSTLISEKFLRLNNIQPVGLVLNGYFANNPSLETTHGYIGYCGYFKNKNLVTEMNAFLDKIQFRNPRIWINDLHKTFLHIAELVPKDRLFYINDESSKREFLHGFYLQNSVSVKYENRKYVPIDF